MKRPITRRILIFIAAFTIVIFVINAYYFNWSWTGFGPKTLWDWLDLFIIPIVLAAGGLWFSRQEKRYELQIAEKRGQDEALQAYLDKMTELLLKEKLRTSSESDEVRSVARARTLTVLRRLDKERRVAVLRFLIESGLIEADKPIVSFVRGDLNYDLSGADLSGTNLSGARLTNANLTGAFLSGARLTNANLSGANLTGARLDGAILVEANLSGANLTGAFLYGASLIEADLTGAILTGVNLSEVDLRNANLTGAILPNTPPNTKIRELDDY